MNLQVSQQQIKVGIFMGGRSLEREVSFNSGRTAYDYLDRTLFEPVALYLHGTKLFKLPEKFLYRGKTTDFVERLEQHATHVEWGELKKLIDVAFILLHGRFGEDGCMQALLTIYKIPFIGSPVVPAALAADKLFQKAVLQHAGVLVPRGICLSVEDWQCLSACAISDRLEQQAITFPVVVKPRAEGSSLGVAVAHNQEELLQLCKSAGSVNGPSCLQDVLIEEKIVGSEFLVIGLYDQQMNCWKTFEPTEIELEASREVFDYDQKYMPGRAHKHTPARFTAHQVEDVKAESIKALIALNMHAYAGVGGILTPEGKVYILDVNSFPGMAPSGFMFMQAAHSGISPTQLLTVLLNTKFILS